LNELERLNRIIPVRILRTGEDGKDSRGAVLETLGMITGSGMITGAEMEPAWKIETEKRGKPYFADHGDTAFSVSDCAGLTAVCFDRTRVGIDLQEHRRGRRDTEERLLSRCLSIAARAFHADENSYVKAASASDPGEAVRRFFCIWSAKEAYVKYTGSGIDDYFSKFSVLPNACESVRCGGETGAFPGREEKTGRGGLPLEETGSASFHALGKWFFCAELYSAEMNLRFSLCICAEKEKPVAYRFG
jgi:phosphopantetheinyl transferase (holo-ACP synthase)